MRSIDPLESQSGAVALRAVGLSKSFASTARGGTRLDLFRDLHLQLSPGETVAIVGRSGAGKSSLLHLLAGLDAPSAGQVWIGDAQITGLNAEAAARLRNAAFGFVWQFHYLLPEFSAAENIALPLMARGNSRRVALREAETWLARVELSDRASNRSGELSGGEQQRVAIARALITRPQVLLADEPTGDLDDMTAAQLFALLDRLCRESGLAAVIVTHNLELASRCDRVLQLSDGKLATAVSPAGT